MNFNQLSFFPNSNPFQALLSAKVANLFTQVPRLLFANLNDKDQFRNYSKALNLFIKLRKLKLEVPLLSLNRE